MLEIKHPRNESWQRAMPQLQGGKELVIHLKTLFSGADLMVRCTRYDPALVLDPHFLVAGERDLAARRGAQAALHPRLLRAILIEDPAEVAERLDRRPGLLGRKPAHRCRRPALRPIRHGEQHR